MKMSTLALLALLGLGVYWWHDRSSFKNGTYVNPRAGLTVRFPSSWTEQPVQNGAEFTAGLSGVEFCVVIIMPPDKPDAVKYLFSNAINRSVASDKDKKGIDEFTINGVQGYRVEGNDTSAQVPLKTVAVAVPLKKSSVVMQCVAPPKRFEDLLSDFNDVISSISSS